MKVLAWTYEEIMKEVKNMENSAKQFKHELFKITWYMRGGVTIGDLYHMSFEDRTIIGDIIKENLETTKRTGMPFY